MNQRTFMQRAIELALQGLRENSGGPFGAVIVRDDRIVAEGWNQVTSTNDPTAHAEIVAIRNACGVLNRFNLPAFARRNLLSFSYLRRSREEHSAGGDDYIRQTIEAFRQIDPDILIPAHCTGDRFYDLAREAMGEKVVHSAVGMRFVFAG